MKTNRSYTSSWLGFRQLLKALVGLVTANVFIFLVTYKGILMKGFFQDNRQDYLSVNSALHNKVTGSGDVNTTIELSNYYGKLRQHGLEPTTLHDFKSPYIFDPPVHDLDSDLQKAPGNRTVKIISCYNCQPWFVTKHFHDHNRDFKRCPYSECIFDGTGRRHEEAELVMFFPYPNQMPPRPVGQIWAFSCWEAPPLNDFPAPDTKWTSVFNWSIGYRQDSDAFFPYNQLAWTAQEELLDDLEYERIAKEKTKTAAWFVSNCAVKSRRNQYVNEMKKYIDIDIYGKCGTGRSDLPTLLKSLNDTYKFYLGFENAFCKDYVTEKLFRNFEGRLHVVTVVRGGFDYHKYLPPKTFIDAKDFKSPKDLALHLKALANDTKSYSAMLKEKDKLRGLNYKHDWCDLCKRLHRGVTPKVIGDMRKYLFENTCWN